MSTYSFRGFTIPARMMLALRAYVSGGHPTGSFLTAVLENNLTLAVGQADEENLHNLPAYIGYLYNEVPFACHGSPEKVREWRAHKRQQS